VTVALPLKLPQVVAVADDVAVIAVGCVIANDFVIEQPFASVMVQV
jgi:hypothetical protein